MLGIKKVSSVVAFGLQTFPCSAKTNLKHHKNDSHIDPKSVYKVIT